MATKEENAREKLDWTLLPWAQLGEVVRALMGRAKEYGRYGWQDWTEGKNLAYRGALLRHVIAYADGELYDPTTGLNHLAHAVANALFLMYYDGGGR